MLIYKPKGVQLDSKMLKRAAEYNPDGWGMAVLKPEGPYIVRGMKWANEILERTGEAIPDYMMQFQEYEAIVHFRKQSSGIISLENTHPIAVNDNVFIAHNGHISEFAGTRQDKLSDTAQFAAWIGLTLEEIGPAILRSDAFWLGIEALLTKRNKLAVIHPEGIRILNRSEGFELTNGLWVSNKNYEWANNNASTRSSAFAGYAPAGRKGNLCALCCGCDCLDCESETERSCLEGVGYRSFHLAICIHSPHHAGVCKGLKGYYTVPKTTDVICTHCWTNYPDYRTAEAVDAAKERILKEQLKEEPAEAISELTKVDDDDDVLGWYHGSVM